MNPSAVRDSGDKYLEAIEHSETHVAHFYSVIIRISHTLLDMTTLLVKVWPYLPPEIIAELVPLWTKRLSLNEELTEVFQTLIFNRVEIIKSIQDLLASLGKTEE